MVADKETKRIAVVGITGNQGGWVAEALLKDKWMVRGLTRVIAKTKKWQPRGVDCVQADMEVKHTFKPALDGCYGMFLMTDGVGNDPQKEVDHGRRAIDCAREAGIKHIVYSSVARANDNTGVPIFESKAKVEAHLEKSGIAYTILQPSMFMQDLTEMKFMPFHNWHVIKTVIGEKKPIQWISCQDIGKAAAVAFDKAGKYQGQRLRLMGDEQTIDKAKEIYKRARGRAPFVLPLPVGLMNTFVPDVVEMYKWMATNSFEADIAMTKELVPDAMDLAKYFRQRYS
jgi:uncharacterized protein YbjT (DUF2867 family)